MSQANLNTDKRMLIKIAAIYESGLLFAIHVASSISNRAHYQHVLHAHFSGLKLNTSMYVLFILDNCHLGSIKQALTLLPYFLIFFFYSLASTIS